MSQEVRPNLVGYRRARRIKTSYSEWDASLRGEDVFAQEMGGIQGFSAWVRTKEKHPDGSPRLKWTHYSHCGAYLIEWA